MLKRMGPLDLDEGPRFLQLVALLTPDYITLTPNNLVKKCTIYVWTIGHYKQVTYYLNYVYIYMIYHVYFISTQVGM